MSFFKSIKSAFGGSDNEDYDVFGQPTTFVNPFSKDKNVPNHDQEKAEELPLDKQEEYALDAEFADRAARLMDEHTQAVTEMIKQAWKKEREELLALVEESKKNVQDLKEKMQAGEAAKKQNQTRTKELTDKIAELEAERDKLNVDAKSLENRIKAMEVKGEGMNELNDKVEQMSATIEDLQRQIADRDAQIEQWEQKDAADEEGPSVEDLQQQLEQRDEEVKELKGNVADLEQKLEAANEDIKAAEELQKTIDEVQEFKDKKNAEIADLKQQVSGMVALQSDYDQMRKAHIVLQDENDSLKKTIEQLEQTAKQNADVQNRRSIETGNLIDGLKQQLASVSAVAEDFKRKYNSLSLDGNEKAANFAKITAERDDAKAELKRMQVTLQKKQHETQAMMDALAEKDRSIAALNKRIEEISKAAPESAAEALPELPEDPALRAIEDIDWEDDGSMPPHPGEDPRQLSLF